MVPCTIPVTCLALCSWRQAIVSFFFPSMTYNTFQLPDVTAAEYIILFEMLLKYNLHVC